MVSLLLSQLLKRHFTQKTDGIKATCWLEYVAKQSGTHIHHHRCGHGGERLVGNLINQWCSQVPVVGFNSGRYDLQLIRKYFITHLGQENVLSGEKQGRIMYMNTPQFKFLDITNYLAPGITYDKWVKTYGAKQTKSWLRYE